MKRTLLTITLLTICNACGPGTLDDNSTGDDPNVDHALNTCQSPTPQDLRIGINASVMDAITAVPSWGKTPYNNKIDALDVYWMRSLYWNRNHAMSDDALVVLHDALEVRRNKGVRTMMIMGTTALPIQLPDYYTGTDEDWAAYKTAFVEEMKRAVDGLGDVVEAWQLLNEPNLGGEGEHKYRGALPAHRFRELVNAGAAIVRAKDPTATIVAPGLVTYKGEKKDQWGNITVDGNVDTFGPYYLQQATKHEPLNVDVLAFHTYGDIRWNHLSIENLSKAWQGTFDHYKWTWNSAVVNGKNKAPRFWVTEFGGPLNRQKARDANYTHDQLKTYHAEALRVGFALWNTAANKASGLERAFFFSFSDYEGHEGENLGLVDKNIKAREVAYNRFDQLTSEIPVEKRCPVGKTTTPPPTNNGKADLRVERISIWPSAPKVGQDVTINAQIKNDSNVAISGKIGVAFQINNQGFANSFGLQQNLQPFQSQTVTMRAKWKPTSKGTFNIKAIVDDQHEHAESNESNNHHSTTVTVSGNTTPPAPKADLLVERVSIWPTAPKVGENVTISAQIKNNSNVVVSGKIGIGFQVNNQGFADSYALQQNLQPFQSQTVTMRAKWKPTSKGTFNIKAIVDDQHEHAESNEHNNSKHFNVYVQANTTTQPTNKADLVAKQINIFPASPKVGQPVQVQVVVENQSNVASNNRVGVKFKFNNTDITNNWGVQTWAIGPWKSSTITIHTKWTPGWSGQHKIKAIVDDLNQTDESNEHNNVKEIQVRVSN